MNALSSNNIRYIGPATSKGLELADIVRAHGYAYQERHALSDEQRDVLWDVEHCRTDVMGGYIEECDDCGTLRVGYNSCRNRHCPKCQRLAQETWLSQQASQLLPIEYFHVVFTLPHDLNRLIRFNKRVCYDLLFKTVTQTLQQFARCTWDGQLGITCVLHTWGQSLCEHVHLHCVVTGGALREDGSRFIRCPSGFLFSVKALGVVFRAKYVQGLFKRYRDDKLHFPGELGQYADEGSFLRYLGGLPKKRFVVYSKGSFADPSSVLEYLGRYTHRIAISNGRLLSLSAGKVTFRYKDYRADGQIKELCLPVDTFLSRYLSHVLPKGYVRIRHFGLVSPGCRRDKLSRCRALLGATAPVVAAYSTAELMYKVTGMDISVCPSCGRGKMQRRWEFSPGLSPPMYRMRSVSGYVKSA